MRALVQRVARASVVIDGQQVAQIGEGLLVLVGVTHGDDYASADKLAGKVARLRVFADGSAPSARALLDLPTPQALVVSQFTLYGDTRKGTRPSWQAAAPADRAEPLVEAFATTLAALGVAVRQGVFGAHMQVESVNDGPVTLLLEV